MQHTKIMESLRGYNHTTTVNEKLEFLSFAFRSHAIETTHNTFLKGLGEELKAGRSKQQACLDNISDRARPEGKPIHTKHLHHCRLEIYKLRGWVVRKYVRL
jgi:hypothetical protein